MNLQLSEVGEKERAFEAARAARVAEAAAVPAALAS